MNKQEEKMFHEMFYEIISDEKNTDMIHCLYGGKQSETH